MVSLFVSGRLLHDERHQYDLFHLYPKKGLFLVCSLHGPVWRCTLPSTKRNGFVILAVFWQQPVWQYRYFSGLLVLGFTGFVQFTRRFCNLNRSFLMANKLSKALFFILLFIVVFHLYCFFSVDSPVRVKILSNLASYSSLLVGLWGYGTVAYKGPKYKVAVFGYVVLSLYTVRCGLLDFKDNAVPLEHGYGLCSQSILRFWFVVTGVVFFSGIGQSLGKKKFSINNYQRNWSRRRKPY